MAGKASAALLCTASSVSAPPPSEAHRPDIAVIFIARYARGTLRTPCFAAHTRARTHTHARTFTHACHLSTHTRSLHVTCQLACGLEFGGGLGHRGEVRRGNGRRDGHGGGAPPTVTAAAKQKQATRARRYERQSPGAATGEEVVAVRTGTSAGARCAALVDRPPSAPQQLTPARALASLRLPCWLLRAAPAPSPCPRPLTPAPALVRSRQASALASSRQPPSVASSRQPTCPCQELTPDSRPRQRPPTTTGRTKSRNAPCSHAALERRV